MDQKEKILREEEDGSTFHIYTYEDSKSKSTKNCLKEGGKGRGVIRL
jgi:hypothetical protein